MGRVQQPIIDFSGPWDDFMVHGVKTPLLIAHMQSESSFVLNPFQIGVFSSSFGRFVSLLLGFGIPRLYFA